MQVGQRYFKDGFYYGWVQVDEVNANSIRGRSFFTQEPGHRPQPLESSPVVWLTSMHKWELYTESKVKFRPKRDT